MQSSMTMDKSTKVEIGEWFFRYRDYTPIPLIVLLLIFGRPTVLTATVGLIAITFGELFRIYSVGFIGTVSRTRSQSTGQKLITEGPFSYVRNPLYVGNLGITAGFAIFGGVAWIFLVTVALFAIQYFFIIRYEENLLTEKFGQEYTEYKREVPRWIPQSLPKLETILWPDTFSPALKSEKRTLTTIFVLIFLLAFLA
jgi:protein-S-isoprenylcysteine O-methyltransferase Ste14